MSSAGDPKPEPTASFSAVMHEIRNQLAVAKANLEAFIDGKIPVTPERLTALAQTIDQLARLTLDLREVPGDVHASAEPRRINVCVLLQGEFRAIEAVAAAKRISMSVTQCAHRARECENFYGDPARIGQIIKNVLLNAVRYTPEGGSIAVDCSRVADEVQVTISDTGPGIPSAEIPRVFEPGYRGSSRATAEGTGQGLAIVKHLVEELGGEVRVLEGDGGGATFVVRLPGESSSFARQPQ